MSHIQARHISGGAASGIGFGVVLFVLVSISLALWYRRVHRDLYSKDPNTWGGSWGVKAQRELQERIDGERAAKWARDEEERERVRAEDDVREMMDLEAQRHEATNAGDSARAVETGVGGSVK